MILWVTVWPSGVTDTMVTVFPAGTFARMLVSDAGEGTCWPAAAVITSPAARPAAAAGLWQSAPSTSAPDEAGAMWPGIPAAAELDRHPLGEV